MRSSGFLLRNVFNFDDVQDGTANNVRRNSVSIWMQADVERVLLDESGIVVKHVVRTAVAHINAKWFKRVGPHHFSQLLGIYHRSIIAKCPSFFNHGNFVQLRYLHFVDAAFFHG